TPVSGQVPLPTTPATPMRVSGANTRITTGGQPEAPAVPATAVRRGVLDRPTIPGGSQPPRSSALPWAIAAVLLLAVAGGGYAMRGSVPALAGLFGSKPATIVDTTVGANATTTPTAAHDEIAASVTPSTPPVDQQQPLPPPAEDAPAATTPTDAAVAT